MINISFVMPSGDTVQCGAEAGESLMRAAVNNDIRGIMADCGGACTCATCHVHIAPEWWDRLLAPNDIEVSTLEMVCDPSPTSRLACQVELAPEHDGLQVIVPASQI